MKDYITLASTLKKLCLLVGQFYILALNLICIFGRENDVNGNTLTKSCAICPAVARV
jgi:hypothetical protein